MRTEKVISNQFRRTKLYLACGFLSFTLAACGGAGEEQETPVVEDPTTENPVNDDQSGGGSDPTPVPPEEEDNSDQPPPETMPPEVEEPPEDDTSPPEGDEPPVTDPPPEDDTPPVDDTPPGDDTSPPEGDEPPVTDPPPEDDGPPVDQPPPIDDTPPVDEPPPEDDTPPEEEDDTISIKPAYGIFALDGAAGTYRDANIRDYDFVDGYAWRVSWQMFEPSEGVFDFAGFDHIISELAPLNQELSILIMSDFPAWTVAHPDIDTWVDDGELKPSPWDPDLHARYDRLVTAMANYQVADPAAGGQPVALKDHSMLTILHPNIPGLPRGGLRNGATTDVAGVPGYSRDKLAAAIGASLTSWQANFPAHPKLMSLWTIQDSDRSNTLWEFAQDELAKYANVGVFQDNLQSGQACSTCSVETGPMEAGMGQALIHETVWSGFQMLGSWANPNPNHQDNLEGGVPEQGLEFALEAYDSLYFEVYTADLDTPEWQDTFRAWQQLLKLEAEVRQKTIPIPIE